MKGRLLSPHSTGGWIRRFRGVLGLAPRASGARFAAGEPSQPQPSQPAPSQPEPAAPAPPAGAHPAHHHPPHKPHRNNTPLIFILATVGVIAAFVAVLLVMRSKLPTYEEIYGKLTTTAADGKRVYAVLARDEFRQVVNVEPESDEKDAVSLYFYSRVKGGRVEVVIDRDTWSRGQARVKSVQLLGR